MGREQSRDTVGGAAPLEREAECDGREGSLAT